jgi:hypothetical protein
LPRNESQRGAPSGARLIPAWSDASAQSVRDAQEAGLGKSDYKRLVREVMDNRDTQIRALVDSLPPEERKLVLSIIQDIRDRGGADYSLAFSHIWEIDYKRKPVTIESFLNDDYYLGQFTETLFPKWRADLGVVFGPGAHCAEWLMGGAIGAGKTYTAMIALTYLVYRMSCLRDPQRYYSLAHKTGTIVFGVYSVTMTQATDVGFDYVRSFVDHSPYFQENFPINPRLKRRIDFLNADISIRAGSREFHALGQNLFALCMDEVNFMQAVSKDHRKREASVEKGQAEKIYNATITRLKSRYIRPGGYVPGMMFLISSKQDEQAFLERRKKDAADEIAAKRVYVSEYSVWEVRPPERFTLPKFYVEVGDSLYPSRILDAKSSAEAVTQARAGADVLEVPGEYRDAFVRDVEQSLRDLAGIATYGISLLIREGARVNKCLTDAWQHPFTRQEITITDEDDVQLDSYFQPLKVFRVERSRHLPRLNPHMPRTINIDIAFTGDSLGLACGHVEGFEEFRRFRTLDGSEYTERLPLVNIDFMLRVMPPARGEIDLLKVQRFIQSLRDQGMPIQHITTDGYQSTYLMQLFRKLGFQTTVLSMDRNDEPYMIAKQAIYDRRARFYRHDWFMLELSRLERNLDDRTVDHPRMFDADTPGSKDVADAFAGVLYHCTINPDLSLGLSGVDSGVVASGIGSADSRDILAKPTAGYNPAAVQRRLRSLRNDT